jgi:hypothetical protein
MNRMITVVIVMIGFWGGLLAQPKPFDPSVYQDGQKNLSDREREHYNEYKKKYIKLGLETETKNGNLAMFSNYMLNLFYHYRIDIDKIEDYKKELDINLKGISKGESNLNKGGYNLLFSHAIVIATLINAKNTKLELSPFSGEAIYNIDEVLKGEYYFEEFPKTIKCYYYGRVEQHSIEISHYLSIYDEEVKPGDKFILFLNYRGEDEATKDYEDYDKPNTYFEPFGYKINCGSVRIQNFIDYAIDFAKKMEKINVKEATHPSRSFYNEK